MNTSFTTFTHQAQSGKPDGRTKSMQGLGSINSPECGFDGPTQIIDTHAYLSNQQGRQYVTATLSLSLIEGSGKPSEQPVLNSQVLYEIHVLATPGLYHAPPTYSYQFRFQNRFTNQDSILQSFLGMIQEDQGTTQDVCQTYTVTRVDHRHRGKGRKTVLGTGMVSLYGSDICELEDGHRAFVGQLDQSIDIDMPRVFHAARPFFSGSHSQAWDNPPILVLQIPASLLGCEQPFDGIYATKKSLNWGRELLNHTSSAAHGRWGS